MDGDGVVPLSTLKFDELVDSPVSPENSDKIDSLRATFTSYVESFSSTHKLTHTPKEVLDNFYFAYGGENRFYERFLLARNHNLGKSEKMVKQMLNIRFEVLGPNLFSKLALTKDLTCKGDDAVPEGTTATSGEKSQPQTEVELFAKIDSYWPIEYFAFSTKATGRFLVMAGKLKDIKPGEFINTFNKDEIKRFYFQFVERGGILQRYENSSPFRLSVADTGDKGKNAANQVIVQPKENEWKRVVEIYDFNGISMKQLHISGLRVLADVLKIGQTCFPENVEKTFFINAPWFFSAAWSVVKLALDKETLTKITISSGDCKKELLEVLGSEQVLKDMWNVIDTKMTSSNATK